MTHELIETLVVSAVAYVLGAAALFALAWALADAFGSSLEPKDDERHERRRK